MTKWTREITIEFAACPPERIARFRGAVRALAEIMFEEGATRPKAAPEAVTPKETAASIKKSYNRKPNLSELGEQNEEN